MILGRQGVGFPRHRHSVVLPQEDVQESEEDMVLRIERNQGGRYADLAEGPSRQ